MVEQADRPGVGVALEVSTDPVVTVPQSVEKKAALGIQQQPSGFNRGAGNHNQIGRLFLQASVGIVVGNAGGVAAFAGENLPDGALTAQLAVAVLMAFGMTVL